MKKILTFNAITQKDEEAVVTIDVNGEYLLKFEDGSFFKLPGDLTKKQIQDALEANKKNNEGQISQAKIEKANEEKLKNI